MANSKWFPLLWLSQAFLPGILLAGRWTVPSLARFILQSEMLILFHLLLILDLFPPDKVLWADNPDASGSLGELIRWLVENRTPVTFVFPDAVYDLGNA
jgi:hypothetical protein